MIGVALLLQLQAAGPVDVSGRVTRILERDTLPAAGARVVLHRVGPTTQGPLDSTVADGNGGFRFRSRADSGDVLLVSARWHGVDYFAPPVAAIGTTTVEVADTASAAAVHVAARHVIIGGPAADGSRDVVDLIVLRNAGHLTRSARDSLTGTWTMLLPPLVANLVVGDADFAREAFDVHGDTLHLFAPIPPGDRQFFLQYQVAPRAVSLRVPLATPTDTISVLAEEDALDLPATMVRQGTEEMSGRRFTRWSGRGVAAGVEITFPGNRATPRWLLPLLIVVVALPLAWATRTAMRRRPAIGERRSE